MRRQNDAALAREIAEGLARTLEALRAQRPAEVLEAELDLPASLLARPSRRGRPSGVWVLRVSAGKGREPIVKVEKHGRPAVA